MTLLYQLPGFDASGVNPGDIIDMTAEEKAISSLPYLVSWVDFSRRGHVDVPEAIDAANGDHWAVRTITRPAIEPAYANLNGLDAIDFTAGGNQALRTRKRKMTDSYTVILPAYIDNIPNISGRIWMTYNVTTSVNGMVIRFENRNLTFNPGVNNAATAFSHDEVIADASKHIFVVSFDATSLEAVLYIDTVASGQQNTFTARSAPNDLSFIRFGSTTSSDIPEMFCSDLWVFNEALHRHTGVLDTMLGLVQTRIALTP